MSSPPNGGLPAGEPGAAQRLRPAAGPIRLGPGDRQAVIYADPSGYPELGISGSITVAGEPGSGMSAWLARRRPDE